MCDTSISTAPGEIHATPIKIPKYKVNVLRGDKEKNLRMNVRQSQGWKMT
jgi:hypothetical protein